MPRKKIRPSQRLIALAAMGLLALAAGCGGSDGERQPGPVAPGLNVLVLMTDDQTNADLRVMPKTQRLLASEGTSFSRFYTSYPLCCPSRTTFLTGQYAHNTGVQGNFPDTDGGGILNLRDPGRTIAAWLHSGGYETSVVGKWPELPPPGVPPGWSHWLTTTQSTIAHYYDYALNSPNGPRPFGSKARDYNTNVLTRLSKGLMERSAHRGKRFFLWVSYTAPHFGFGRDDPASRRCGSVPAPGKPAGQTAVPAPADAGAFEDEKLPRPPSFNERDMSDKPPFLRPQTLDRADFDEMRTDYRCRLASLLGVDRSVAKLVATLRRTGELDRTLIVFTSDNGFMLGQHREAQGKNLPYEEAIRVPLVIRGPGIPANATVSDPTANVDLAPTILAATRTTMAASKSRPADGTSLLPLTKGNADPDRAILIEGRDDASPHGHSGSYEAISYQGVRTSRYLYVEWHRAVEPSSQEAADAPIGAGPVVGRELYDTQLDPDELDNRIESAGYEAPRRKLGSILAGLENCSGHDCVVSAAIPPPAGG